MKKYHLTRYFTFALVSFGVAFMVIYGLLYWIITKQKLKMILLIIGRNIARNKRKKIRKEKEKEKKSLGRCERIIIQIVKESDNVYDPKLNEMDENVRK